MKDHDSYQIHSSWEKHPLLLEEINLSKNTGLTYKNNPVHVLELSVGTDKKLDWKCSICEHEWSTRGYVRLRSGCPACADQVLHSDGRNSLAAKFPRLAKEYQGDANLVIPGTNKKLAWKCAVCDHAI